MLLAGVGAALVSQHLFASFGLVPSVELLAAALVVGGRGRPGGGRFRSLETRFLVQTVAVAAGVGAALSAALPLGLARLAGFRLGPDGLLLAAGLVGVVAIVAMRWLAAWPPLSPAAPWPRAESAVEVLRGAPGPPDLVSGLVLLAGLGAGLSLSPATGLPGPGPFGLALLGDPFGLGVLALGLLVRPLLPALLDFDLLAAGVPQGLMIGAALVALLQATGPLVLSLLRDLRAPKATSSTTLDRSDAPFTTVSRPLLLGRLIMFGLFFLVALVLFTGALDAVVRPPPLTLLGWALVGSALIIALQLFATLLTARLGWLPLLGGGLVALAVASHLELAPAAALIVALLALAAGPLAAELGTQLAVGARLGLEARPGQVVIAGLVGLGVAILVTGLTFDGYARQALIPPPAQALATALELVQPSWRPDARGAALVAGALLQLVGGPRRQVGLLLGTGLLVAEPQAGWALLGGLAFRGLVALTLRQRASIPLAVLGLGLIAGEAIAFLAA